MNMKHLLAGAAAAVLAMTQVAMADTVFFDGYVVGREAEPVYAAIGGTVENVYLTPGQRVTPEDVILSLRTNCVYADESGTVTGVFGVPGDSAETISSRYGAVMYLEGTAKYTVAANTSGAYGDAETSFVHVGETVYIVAKSKASRTGKGMITSVSAANYTIDVTSGSFLPDETVTIYRDEEHSNRLKVGSGKVNRKDPIAMTGSGSIVAVHVKDGDRVSRGDLLFETLPGAFDGYYMSGKDLYVGMDGVVSQLPVTVGTPVQKDSVIAYVYRNDSMRIEGSLPEADLNELKVGDTVALEFNHTEQLYTGTVSMISAVAQSNPAGSGVTFAVYIDFEPDESIRYGMSVLISTEEDGAADAEEVE